MAYGGGDEAPVLVDVSLKLRVLIARSSHPPREPRCGEVGLRGAESPGARPLYDLHPCSAELLGGHDGGVRAKPAVAALVGVEGGGHATVEGIRRRQIDATGDG